MIILEPIKLKINLKMKKFNLNYEGRKYRKRIRPCLKQ